tara:strand:- start:826 stop:1017 length:192 start_codon:yes stop_codon:yes gene_type:complete
LIEGNSQVVKRHEGESPCCNVPNWVWNPLKQNSRSVNILRDFGEYVSEEEHDIVERIEAMPEC